MKPLCCPAALALLVVTTPIVAQEPPARPWKLQTDFGLVNTAGNTSTTTLNAGQQGSYLTGRWILSQTFSAVYGRTDGRKSAENYAVGGRIDYHLTDGLGTYLHGGWSQNRFAGIARRFEEGAGLTYKAVTTATTTLGLEAGATLTQQRDLAGVANDFAGARGAVAFKQMLTQKAYFQQLAEILPNLKTTEDLRVDSETALVAPLSSSVALKAGYVVKFDNLPEPGFKKTDRYLTTGLQVVF